MTFCEFSVDNISEMSSEYWCNTDVYAEKFVLQRFFSFLQSYHLNNAARLSILPQRFRASQTIAWRERDGNVYVYVCMRRQISSSSTRDDLHFHSVWRDIVIWNIKEIRRKMQHYLCITGPWTTERLRLRVQCIYVNFKHIHCKLHVAIGDI